MRKLISRIGLAALGIMSAALCFAQGITVTVNGQPVQFPNAQPQVVNDRVLVPLRGVFQQMGAYVHWTDATQTINATKGNISVQLQIGNSNALVNGRSVAMDVPPQLMNNSTMVPLRFVSEALGADVNWVSAQNLVAITTHIPDQHFGPPVERIRVFPVGAVFPLRLDTPLGSNTSRTGDSFTGTLVTFGAPSYGGLPAGTNILGHVEYARPRTPTEPGCLKLMFDSVQLPNGALVPITGDLIGLDNKSVVRDRRGIMLVNPQRVLGPQQAPVWVGSNTGLTITFLAKKAFKSDIALKAELGHWVQGRRTVEVITRDVFLPAGTQMGVRLLQQFALP